MRWMMLILMCVFAVSCASDPQAAPKQQQATSGTRTMNKPEPWLGATPMQAPAKPQQETARQSQQQSSRKPINASSAGRNDTNANIPPKDAQYTLYCADYVGPSHVETANRAKQELAELSGMRGWYIIHQEDRSSLFYGYYRDVEEAAIKRDRAAIEGLEDRRGNKAVRAAMPVSVDAPDPIAPPEWNLLNARNGELDTKHFWTLQIAAYQGSPERKQYAVEAVKAARQEGVQAYYYHGPSVSSVCIGVWPLEALRRPDDESVRPDGRNPSGQLMITSGDLVAADQPADNRLMPQKLVDKANQHGTKMESRLIQILDPTLRAAMEQYPQHYINGAPEGVNVRGKIVPKESMVVLIPATGNTASLPSAPPPPSNDAMRALQPEPPPPSSGGGRLKSIGK